MTALPHTLGGRLLLLLSLAVVGAQVAAFALFAAQTSAVERAAIRTRTVDGLTTLSRVLRVVPAGTAPGVVAAFGTPQHRFSLDTAALVPNDVMGADEARLARRLDERMGTAGGHARIALSEENPNRGDVGSAGPTGRLTLRASVRLDDRVWLNSTASLPGSRPSWMRIGLYQAMASLVAVAVATTFAMSSIVRPVMALSSASERAGRGVPVPRLPERGPRELHAMTVAFNAMQRRLEAFVSDRTRMLAAIGHDLRTPIASLWLRAEMVEDATLRGAMVRTLSDMRDMVEVTLDFAREDVAGSEGGPYDLAELLRGIVDEHRLLDRDVTLAAPAACPMLGRPLALRRAFDNLIGNAVRYGDRAQVHLDLLGGCASVRVEDEGPGIPAERMEEMFLPFTRLDDARDAASGGTGLGLSVARSCIRAHGGEIRLRNGPRRGLVAEVTLPSAPGASSHDRDA